MAKPVDRLWHVTSDRTGIVIASGGGDPLAVMGSEVHPSGFLLHSIRNASEEKPPAG